MNRPRPEGSMSSPSPVSSVPVAPARPVLANTSALVLLRGSNLALRLGLLFLIARVVQPPEFGHLVLALSVVEVGKVLADFGMDTIAIRQYALAADRVMVGGFAGSFAWCRVVCAAAVQSGLIAWFLVTQPPATALVGVVLSFSVWTSLLQGFSLDWFQARLRVGRALWPVLAANLTGGALAALAVTRVAGLQAKELALPALELLVGAVLLLVLRGEAGWALGRPTSASTRALFRASVPVAATAILVMLYSRLDVLVMADRVPAADLGRYGIAVRLTEPFQIAAAVFGLSVFSRFVAWFKPMPDAGNAPPPGSLRAAVLRYVAGTLAYGVVCAGMLYALAPTALTRFLPAYISAVPVVRLLAGVLVFRSLNATMAGMVQAAGHFRALTLLASWSLASVFALMLFFVPRAGAEGAALALLLGEGAGTLILALGVTRIVTRVRVDE